MKLGLGTAQLGLNYGISNAYGRATSDDCREIFAAAAECGVRCLDTAPMYGGSESVIGEHLPTPNPFSIVTKTPCFGGREITAREEDAVEETVKDSLRRLRQSGIYGLLAHHTPDLFAPGGDRIYKRMRGLKADGVISKIGVSVYNSDQIDAVLGHFDIDLIQLPLNVFDQRLIDDGRVADLKRRGIEVHARSIFLQGVLLMEPDSLPRFFDPVREHIRAYWRELKACGLTPLEAALQFVVGIPEIDIVVCGVAQAAELRQIRVALDTRHSLPDFSRFGISDPAILNPSTWVL